MILVTVIPLIKTLNKDFLTYFSAKEISIGDVVMVPIRKKDVPALVIETSSLGEKKGDIKSADFNLRKIKQVIGPSVLAREFLKSAEDIKNYFVSSTGQVLNTFLPKILFDAHMDLSPTKQEPKSKNGLFRERFAFGAPKEDRLVIYRTYLRESFSKKESVFFCFPTTKEAKDFQDKISKGIEKYCYFFDAGISKKDFIKKYQKIEKEDHPVVVFSTPSFLFLPIKNLGTIIVENENSSGYIASQKPYIDSRVFVDHLSKNQNSKIIFADSLLRTETIWQVKRGKMLEFRPTNWRLPEKEEETVIDMRAEEKDFKIISKKAFIKIKEAEKLGQRTLIFNLKKGYANMSVCGDCGEVVKMNGENLMLFEDKTGKRYFKSEKSPKIYDANILCQKCTSWNIVPLGIGTQKIKEEILRIKKEEKVFVLDKNKAKTEKAVREVIEKFYNTKDGVLICTQIALPYIDKKIDNIIISSIDSLFNIPSWNTYEKILNLITLLNTKTNKSLLLQTRNAHEEILLDIKERNLIKFWRDDIENRKQWQYPPFFTLIKVSYDSNEKEKNEVVKYLKKTYEKWSPIIKEKHIYKNIFKISMLIKLEKDDWSAESLNLDKNLLEKLKVLPSYWTIQINPAEVL